MTHLLNPEETYVIDDNKTIIEILTEQHLLDRLVPKQGYNAAHVLFDLPHHWCMAVLHTGHEDDNENGYNLVAVPKTQSSKETATRWFSEVICDTVSGKILVVSNQSVAPEKN